jgi:hypothetical protein
MTLEIVSALYIASLLLLNHIHREREKDLFLRQATLERYVKERLDVYASAQWQWREITKNNLMHLAHKTNRAARISEKMADRAFNIANSAQLGVATISKALASRPRLRTKENLAQNEYIKKKVDEMFPETEDGQLEWLKAVLSDDELEALERAQELTAKRS